MSFANRETISVHVGQAGVQLGEVRSLVNYGGFLKFRRKKHFRNQHLGVILFGTRNRKRRKTFRAER